MFERIASDPHPPPAPQPICLADLATSEGQPKVVGAGFEVSWEMTITRSTTSRRGVIPHYPTGIPHYPT
jgi:hypothetical protein